MEKRFSFIVPVYEPDLALFERCVKSLCDQSISNWEAVFVLDGPNENAKQVINRLFKKKPNHFKILEQEHSGVQRARNFGGEHAKGDFLVFWDCDCIIEPEASKVWLDQFEKHPEIGFVYSGYQFLNEGGAIQSEPFDPYTLRIRNYVSTCFPLRREFYPGWTESLKSLQDWDYWLSAVEKGAVGKFMPGFAFSTALPDSKSISGQGCTNDVWLERIDAVKKLHNLPERDVCVSSLGQRHEGIRLAKLIGADYQDLPNWRPHRYKTIIQIGFSFIPGRVEHHSSIFGDRDVKHILFWTCDDITEVFTRCNLKAIWKYSALLRNVKQFVEDKAAYDLMSKAGFNVEILPLPIEVKESGPLPERPKFVVDSDPSYSFIFELLQKSLPDVDIEPVSGAAEVSKTTGLIHFHPDRTVSNQMKRMLLSGRAVISNVQAPFMGFVNDDDYIDGFLPALVEKVRELVYGGIPQDAKNFYLASCGPEKLKELVNA